MSPSRASSKRNSSSGFKPYTRGVEPIAVLPSDMQDLKLPGGTVFPSPMATGNGDSDRPPIGNMQAQHTPIERPGFPTYAQYKQVEAAYIQSLTPRRQGKALISQALFDRIWDVLHQPDSQGETAQFRFWARKMFTLSRTHRNKLGGFNNQSGPREVLLHDNLLVAIQEQLYDLLCFCHGSTGHGGRDKTCALIRKHYTWVPKDLVSSFIKACPTCIMKKCGNLDSVTLASQMAEQRAEDMNFRIPEFFPGCSIGADSVYLSLTSEASLSAPNAVSSIPWPAMPGPEDVPGPHNEEADPIEVAYRQAVSRARIVKASLSGMGNPNLQGLQGVPMSREVSLYKGLPNGWQYRHSDYASAHAEFMKTKHFGIVQDGDLGVRAQRPRIPSILPLWGPDHFAQGDYPMVQDTDLGDPTNMLSFSPLAAADQQEQTPTNASLPYFLLGQHPQFDAKEDPQHLMPQIDPLLMHLSASNVSRSASDCETETDDVDQTPDVNMSSLTPSTSLKRAAAPPPLHLDFSMEKAFMSYRNNTIEGDTTPDSPLMGINWQEVGKPSPTGSDNSLCSGSSQFSPFAVPPMSASTTVTPASSALQTPVDEFLSGTGGSEISKVSTIKGERKLLVEGSGGAAAVEIELSDGIEQVCGL